MTGTVDKQQLSKHLFLQLIGKDTCVDQHADRVRVYRSQSSQIPLVRCTVCDWSIDVYAECRKPPERDDEVFRSSRLAEAFAHWTGDVQVPIQLTFPPLPGIVPAPVVTPLNMVYNAVQALRTLNAPFASPSAESELNPKILTHFLKEYSLRVQQCGNASEPPKNSTEDKAKIDGRTMMLQILTAFRKQAEELGGDENGERMFEHYGSEVVPYVLSVAEEKGDVKPTLVEVEGPLAKQLYLQVLNSSRVRSLYGRYSLMLELVHIMVTCYACLTNETVAANWTFDVVARVLRGDFFHVDTPSLRKVQAILLKYVNRRTDTDLYYVVRGLQQSEKPEELYSDDFFEKFDRISKLVKKHLAREGEAKKKSNLEMMLYSAFPEVLFSTHANSLGFTVAMAHTNSMTFRSKFGPVCPKGTISIAKHLHRVVRSLVEQMQAFERNEEGHVGEVFWTIDTFQAFMATNDKLNVLVMDLVSMFTINMAREERARMSVHDNQTPPPPIEKEAVEQDESPPTQKKPCPNRRYESRMFGNAVPQYEEPEMEENNLQPLEEVIEDMECN